ncbi:MAG: AraC family transcriptional regulator [Duncaniella sp.]|nr:AraC family transcriptional regulator [Duncaniella sp.]
MKLGIKNMVCPRCVEAVTDTLHSLGIDPEEVTIGSVTLPCETMSKPMRTRLAAALEARGFELIDSPADATVEALKRAIAEHVRTPHECRLKLSRCLENQFNVPYDTLSRLFTSREGRSVEKFHIAERVAWVTELINRGDKTVSEIAHITGYSSLSHLSRQFKSVMGVTPSEYIAAHSPQ